MAVVQGNAHGLFQGRSGISAVPERFLLEIGLELILGPLHGCDRRQFAGTFVFDHHIAVNGVHPFGRQCGGLFVLGDADVHADFPESLPQHRFNAHLDVFLGLRRPGQIQNIPRQLRRVNLPIFLFRHGKPHDNEDLTDTAAHNINCFQLV